MPLVLSNILDCSWNPMKLNSNAGFQNVNSTSHRAVLCPLADLSFRLPVLDQSSFYTTWASLFEIELEPNSIDWNGNELEHELELRDMKRTILL